MKTIYVVTYSGGYKVLGARGKSAANLLVTDSKEEATAYLKERRDKHTKKGSVVRVFDNGAFNTSDMSESGAELIKQFNIEEWRDGKRVV